MVHVEFQPPLRPASSVPHWDEEEARNEDVAAMRFTLRREIGLGSWGVFCDISGQVTESPG